MAREIGWDRDLAHRLWASAIHEARILAPMIDDPRLVTEAQMESWVKDFDSWDICDGCCANLFEKTGLAYQKAVEWSARDGRLQILHTQKERGGEVRFENYDTWFSKIANSPHPRQP
jgi:3-methyladenine DNA glycosylase AlkD